MAHRGESGLDHDREPVDGAPADAPPGGEDWLRQRGEDAPVMEFAREVSGHDPGMNAEFARSMDGEGFRPSWACEEDGERAAVGASKAFWDSADGWSGEERTEMAVVVAGLMVDPVGTLVRQALSENSFTRALIGEIGSFLENQADRARDLLADALSGFSDNPQADVLEAREILLRLEEEALAHAEDALPHPRVS